MSNDSPTPNKLRWDFMNGDAPKLIDCIEIIESFLFIINPKCVENTAVIKEKG